MSRFAASKPVTTVCFVCHDTRLGKVTRFQAGLSKWCVGGQLPVGGFVVCLRSLGLGKYEAVFRENEIDETVLPSLTEEHLKQLGALPRAPWLKVTPAARSARSRLPC